MGLTTDREGLPAHPAFGGARNLCSGTLIDPQFKKTQLVGSECGRTDPVSRRRHMGFDSMSRHLQEEAFVALPGNDHRSAVGAFQNTLSRLQDEITQGQGVVVTGQAVFPEDGQEVLLEVNRLASLQLGNGNRLGPVTDTLFPRLSHPQTDQEHGVEQTPNRPTR